MLALLTWTILLSAVSDPAAHPSLARQDTARGEPSGAPAFTGADALDVGGEDLEEVTALRDRGRLDAARARLAELLGEGSLGEEDGGANLDALLRAEDLAESLDAPELVRHVRRRIVERLIEDSGPEHPDTLVARLNLAVSCTELGDLETASRLEEAAHAGLERQLPIDHPDLLWAKENLALTRAELGDLRGALDLEEEIVAILGRTLAPTHPDLLAAMMDLAVTRSELGDHRGAFVLEQKVLRVRQRTLPPEHPDRIAIERNLAITYRELGDWKSAARLQEGVLAALESSVPEGHPDRIEAQRDLAESRAALGDLEEALELEEHVHAVLKRELAPDDPLLDDVRQELAITRAESGDLPGALELEERVLEVRAAVLSPDDPALLSAMQNLGATRAELGDLEGALELAEQVHAAQQRLLPPDHPSRLLAEQNLAATRFLVADFEGARELFEHVLAVREDSLPADHPELVDARQNVTLVRARLGDVAGALQIAEEVLAARRGRLHGDHPLILEAVHNVGTMRLLLGDARGAGELLEEVRVAQSSVLPPEHPERLKVGLDLAAARTLLGDLDGALELRTEVHEACRRSLPAHHPMRLQATSELAWLRDARGERERAIELTRSLLDGQLELARLSRLESPRVGRAATSRELGRLAVALSLTVAQGSEESGALDARLFGVLEGLRSVAAGAPGLAAAAARSPGLRRSQGRLTETGAELGALVHRVGEAGRDLDGWRNRLVELAAERDRLQREIRQSLADSGLLRELPTAERAAWRLGPDAALVAYARYVKQPRGRTSVDPPPAPVDAFVAFLVTRDALVRRIELGPAAAVEERVDAWRSGLGRPVRGRGVAASPPAGEGVQDPSAGTALRRLVLDPVLARVRDARELHVVADDVLHLVPLDALPLGGGRVGDRVTVTVHPVVPLVGAVRPVPTDAARLVVIGGVDYDAVAPASVAAVLGAATPPVVRGSGRRGASTGALPESFEPLAGSEAEMRSVARLFRERFEVEPTLLRGTEPDKVTLVRLVPGARFVHLATHGWFAPERFRSTIEGLEEPRDPLRPGSARAQGALVGFAPATLCGLALAGANRGMDRLGRVPGILTAEELATLDLSSCELAVLSACETNVGFRRAGQGIQSLQTALYAAGARTAITSLWKVDDAWTRELMTEFYRLIWVEEMPKAEALWQAKMTIREQGAGLADWAGWVLTGDPD